MNGSTEPQGTHHLHSRVFELLPLPRPNHDNILIVHALKLLPINPNIKPLPMHGLKPKLRIKRRTHPTRLHDRRQPQLIRAPHPPPHQQRARAPPLRPRLHAQHVQQRRRARGEEAPPRAHQVREEVAPGARRGLRERRVVRSIKFQLGRRRQRAQLVQVAAARARSEEVPVRDAHHAARRAGRPGLRAVHHLQEVGVRAGGQRLAAARAEVAELRRGHGRGWGEQMRHAAAGVEGGVLDPQRFFHVGVQERFDREGHAGGAEWRRWWFEDGGFGIDMVLLREGEWRWNGNCWEIGTAALTSELPYKYINIFVVRSASLDSLLASEQVGDFPNVEESRRGTISEESLPTENLERWPLAL